MISSSYSIDNSLSTVILPQTVELPPLNLFLQNKKLTTHDRIVQHLIQTKIMNLDGSFNLESLKLNLSLLENKIIERLGLMLYNQFTIKSTAIHPFEFSISLQELFSNLDIHNIEIIGGTVYSLLGPEIIQELARILKIPAEWIDEDFLEEYKNPAADIDIRVHVTDDPQNWLNKVVAFFQSKLINIDKHRIQKEAFTNYFIYNPNPLDHFGIVSFGDPLDVSIDLIFEKDLKRKNLFKHDAFKFDIAYFGTPFCRVKPSTHNIPILEAMILRLTKTIDADNPDEVDIKGSAKLLIFLTKGFRWQSNELKTKLLTKFLLSKKYDKLEKITKNHFPNQPQALLFICFNFCQFFPSIYKDQLIDLVKTLLPDVFEDAKYPILNFIHKLMLPLKTANLNFLQGETAIHLIGCFLQFFKSFNSVDVTSSQTLIEDKLFFRLKFNLPKPLYLVVQDCSDSLLSSLKYSLESIDLELKNQQLTLFHQLSTHFTLFPENNFKVNEIDLEAITQNLPLVEDAKTAFSLLDNDHLLLKELGFYSLISSSIQEKTSKNLSHLLTQFLDFLITEESITIKKNLFFALIIYWLAVSGNDLKNNEKEIENFYKALSNSNCKLDDILKSFCINFAGVNQETVKKFIFKIFSEKPDIFNEQSHFLLIEKFSKHSPRYALMLLEETLEKFPKTADKCKKAYEFLLKKYLEPENKMLLYADYVKLSDALIQISFEKTESSEVYLQLAPVLLELDFARGMQFLKSLESSVVLKGFLQILTKITDDKKFILIQELNQNFPLDLSKAMANAIEERLIILLQCLDLSLTEDEIENLNGLIFNFLNTIVNSKKAVSKKLKEIVKPKLESLLIWQLAKKHENTTTQDLISLCFKIANCFYSDIINTPSLQSLLIEKLNQIVSENTLTNILFIKDYLKSKKTYSNKELLLFENLIEKALELKEIKIAEELLRKLLSYAYSKSKLPEGEILKLVDTLLNQLEIENKSLDFLNFIEESFPKLQILNKDEHFKTAILNFSEKDKIKKAEFFLNKSEIILKDEEMLLQVEKFWMSLLTDLSELKNKEKEKLFQTALDILKIFNFTHSHQITFLSETLVKLNNKDFCKISFTKLQECQVPVTSLLPIFKALAIVSPDFYLPYLDKYKKDLAKFEGEEHKTLKQEFVTFLISSFLKLLENKKINVEKVCEAFLFLEKEQSENLDLQFVASFSPFVTHVNVYKVFCEKMSRLFENVEEGEKLKELNSYLAKVLIVIEKNFAHFDKNIFLKEALHLDLTNITSTIRNKITLLTIPDLLEPFITNNSRFSLDYCAVLVEKTLLALPLETSIKKDPLYIPFKKFLKDLVFLSCEKKKFSYLKSFINPLYFTEKERIELAKTASKACLADPETIKNKDKILNALHFFLICFRSPDEPYESLKDTLSHAIDHLTAYVFTFNAGISFFNHLITIVLNFTHYFGDVPEYFEFLEVISQDGHTEAEIILEAYVNKMLPTFSTCKSDNEIMREKFYYFVLLLTKKISAKLDAQTSDLTEEIRTLSLNTCINLIFLIKLFPEKRDETLLATLNYCFAIVRLDLTFFSKCFTSLLTVFATMQKNSFFNESSSKSELVKAFQFMIFTNNKIDSFDSLTDKEKAASILFVLNQMNKNKTFNSYVLTHNLANAHSHFLSTTLKVEFDSFIKTFFQEFMKKFPHLADNPRKHLNAVFDSKVKQAKKPEVILINSEDDLLKLLPKDGQ